MNETLRINGGAALTRDPALLEDLPTGGTRPPRLGLCVEVQEAFLHCAKAFLRGGVWIRRPGSRPMSCPRPPRSTATTATRPG